MQPQRLTDLRTYSSEKLSFGPLTPHKPSRRCSNVPAPSLVHRPDASGDGSAAQEQPQLLDSTDPQQLSASCKALGSALNSGTHYLLITHTQQHAPDTPTDLAGQGGAHILHSEGVKQVLLRSKPVLCVLCSAMPAALATSSAALRAGTKGFTALNALDSVWSQVDADQYQTQVRSTRHVMARSRDASNTNLADSSALFKIFHIRHHVTPHLPLFIIGAFIIWPRLTRMRACNCSVPMCVSIGLPKHTDRGLARVGLTNQDMTKQMCVCVCVCLCVSSAVRTRPLSCAPQSLKRVTRLQRSAMTSHS